jgi:putative membrane protein
MRKTSVSGPAVGTERDRVTSLPQGAFSMKAIRFLAATAVSAAVAAVGASPAVASSNARSTGAEHVSAIDEGFMQSSVQGDLFEIASGTLARQRGVHGETKSLGSTLVADHAMSLNNAKELASRLGIDVPQNMNGTERNEIREMQDENGNGFDQTFAEIETADHLHDIALAHFEAMHGANASVRAMAAEEIPMLTKHLILAVHDAEVSGATTVNRNTVRARYVGIIGT